MQFYGETTHPSSSYQGRSQSGNTHPGWHDDEELLVVNPGDSTYLDGYNPDANGNSPTDGYVGTNPSSGYSSPNNGYSSTNSGYSSPTSGYSSTNPSSSPSTSHGTPEDYDSEYAMGYRDTPLEEDSYVNGQKTSFTPQSSSSSSHQTISSSGTSAKTNPYDSKVRSSAGVNVGESNYDENRSSYKEDKDLRFPDDY